jgi:CDP-diacylglycerol--glycerol-3-phosphate 3-phosphatidyltransferase
MVRNQQKMTPPRSGQGPGRKQAYDAVADWARAKAAVLTQPIARGLGALGLHPNAMTLLGVVCNVGAGLVLASGRLGWGGLAVLAASATDALDGALARVSGQESRFGAFLDSTMDRISEGALFLGLLTHLFAQGQRLEVYLIFVTLLGSVMVSYARARAEGLGYSCKVGLLTRVERMALLGMGLIAGWLRATLLLMAFLVWVTVLQRILHVYGEARRTS